MLALDVGSTGLRVGRYDEDGAAVGEPVERRYRNPAPAGRPDPQRILGVLLDALHALDLDGVAVVATSSVWHAVISTDKDGTPTQPAITWEARMPTGLRDELGERLEGRWSHARSGGYLHPSYATAAIPALGAAAHYTDLGSWLISQLTQTRLSWPENIASGSGLWDQQHRCWDAEALSALGIAPETLGLGWASGIETDCRQLPQLGRAIWLPVVGDGACHNLGQSGIGDRITVTAGTSGSVRALAMSGDSGDADHGLWRYRLDAYLTATGGAITSVGNALEWAERFLGTGIDWAAASSTGALPTVRVDPAVFGRRGPDYAWDASGSISGLTADTTAANVALAFAVDIWKSFRDLATALRRVHGPERILVAEGGVLAHHPAARQLLADALGTVVHQTDSRYPSLDGAGLVGANSLHTGGFDLAGTARAITEGTLAQAELVSAVEPRPEQTLALRERWGDQYN